MDTTALALVEEDIIRLKLALSRLYTQKNTFSFVSRLSNETLADIFIHYASDYYYHEKDQHWNVPPWFSVSYVCRRWRDIALNCPSLWTYISKMPPCWIEELLARSKKASLKIRIAIPNTPDASQFLNSIKRTLEHTECIQELQLSIPFKYTDEVLPNLSSRAPRLQRLKISTPRVKSSPLVLFDGDTPSLRSLELVNIRVSFSLLNARSLRTLRLHRTPGPFQEDMKDFLSTLGYMDSLTHLCLDRAFPCCREFIFSPAFSASQKIRLPHLSQLLVSGPISTVTALLSCLDFPLKAEVRLNSRSESSLEDDTLFTSVLAERYTGIMSADQKLSIPGIRSLIIEFTGGRRRLTCSTSDRGCDFDHPPDERLDWDRNAPLQISLSATRTDDDHNLISDICHCLPLMHLQNVHVVESPDSSDFWRHAFGHLQELRYIKLSGGYMPNITSIFVVEPHCSSTNHHAVQIFAPALEVLELYDVTFPARPFRLDLSLRDALATREEPQVQFIIDRCCEDSESGD